MVDLQRLEECFLNARPALHTRFYDGWFLRLSQACGYCANAAVPLSEGSLSLESKVMTVAHHYRAHGQYPLFRVTGGPAAGLLDNTLARMGYMREEETVVFAGSLNMRSGHASARVSQIDQIVDWLPIYHYLLGQVGDSVARSRMLGALSLPFGLFVLQDEGEAKACGMAVVEDDHVGLFDLVTQAESRRRGYGRELVRAMLSWARRQGARYAYAHVPADNLPAAALARSVGLHEAYRYWYRKAPSALVEDGSTA
jgi:GNAT superfamily N-acetyltransferase